MTLPNTDRTIAAISTAYGESGIGIVRMSGPEAKEIAARIFVPYGRAKDPQNQKQAPRKAFQFKDRHMHYGHVADPKTGETVDEVLCVFMKAPHTYTGEDLVEIQCHGSMVSLRRILELFRAKLVQTFRIVVRPGNDLETVRKGGNLIQMIASDTADPDDSDIQNLTHYFTSGITGSMPIQAQYCSSSSLTSAWITV